MADDHNQLTAELAPTYEDPHQYFMSRLLVGHIAAFEIFLQELMEVVFSRYPQKLGATQFRLSEILDAGSPEPLIARAIAENNNKLMYKKPLEYRDAVADFLSLDVNTIAEHWNTLIEAKARRDLGVHANWQCNDVYLRKLAEAGIPSELLAGQSAVPETEHYLQTVLDRLYILAGLLTNHVLANIFRLPNRVPDRID